MSVEKNVLDLFKVMVISTIAIRETVTYGSRALVLDFVPSAEQFAVLNESYKQIDPKTLYSWDERINGNFHDLITKQILHYVEVYGLDSPGLFDLEVEGATLKLPITFVKGVTEYELGNLVRALIYSNAPVKDAPALVEIIRHYNIVYSVNLIKNNEVRVLLFDPKTDIFSSGDDFVRWVCWKATSNALLIKDRKTVAAVKMFTVDSDLIENHITALAPVFHRHKALILAMKNKSNATVVNKIARMAKSGWHQPLPPAANKTFIADFFAGRVGVEALSAMSIRDKLKFLNVVAERKVSLQHSSYIVRNGKVWVEDNDRKTDQQKLEVLEGAIFEYLRKDLVEHLRGKNILLDNNVHYGLPTSRKQTLGQLPFGTRVYTKGNVSSGVYWENAGGASDLDLSTIAVDGQRTGWGGGRGYNASDIIFSGDITYAPEGAMEFMTNSTKDVKPYGLFVNVFTGSTPCEMQLVVGERDANNKQWIDKCVIREPHKLESRGNLLGFVKGDRFVVYAGRMNGSRISGLQEKAIVEKVNVDYWTINDIFNVCGIFYHTVPYEGVDYDYDLSYSAFTYDKLEALLGLN